MKGPRFSIVMPTHQHREVVLASVRALGLLRTPRPIELIVVADGCTDGTPAALREEPLPFPMTVLEQPRLGLAAARNHGARAARGEVVVFLDDDMAADRDLLVEHERCYRAGAEAVLGHVPVHARSARTLVSVEQRSWARHRRQRLADGRLDPADLVAGHLSVRAEVFAALEGFDPVFGDTDQAGVDLGQRVLQKGVAARFAPAAISHRHVTLTPQQYLNDQREAGGADARLSLKHPDLAARLAGKHGGPRRARLLHAMAALLPPVLRAGVVRWLVGRVAAGRTDAITQVLLHRVRDARYWDGWRRAAGWPRGDAPLRVLAYHEVVGSPEEVADDWAVTADELASHLRALAAQGFSFIDLPTYLRHLRGEPVMRPSVLVTFDDGYRSLREHAAPVLQHLQVPAVVFVVTGQLAGWNRWQVASPEQGRPLLSTEDLTQLRGAGWHVQSHTRTHPHLSSLTPGAMALELGRPRADLTVAGLGTPALLAYPYGDHDWRVRLATRRAGYVAAFALRTRRTAPGRGSRWALPRVEVRRGATAADVVAQTVRPRLVGRSSAVRRELRALGRAVLGSLPRLLPGPVLARPAHPAAPGRYRA